MLLSCLSQSNGFFFSRPSFSFFCSHLCSAIGSFGKIRCTAFHMGGFCSQRAGPLQWPELFSSLHILSTSRSFRRSAYHAPLPPKASPPPLARPHFTVAVYLRSRICWTRSVLSVLSCETLASRIPRRSYSSTWHSPFHSIRHNCSGSMTSFRRPAVLRSIQLSPTSPIRHHRMCIVLSTCRCLVRYVTTPPHQPRDRSLASFQSWVCRFWPAENRFPEPRRVPKRVHCRLKTSKFREALLYLPSQSDKNLRLLATYFCKLSRYFGKCLTACSTHWRWY